MRFEVSGFMCQVLGRGSWVSLFWFGLRDTGSHAPDFEAERHGMEHAVLKGQGHIIAFEDQVL